ncbi:MAG TPA: sugar phosphate isomerase/epimerase [Reyranella sp.]|nr:sugar phosphate isomerase/epimerase [Reyranella sp.]
MNRRTLLSSGLASAIASSARAADTTHIGVQLYTVRTLLERDYDGTLAKIAALGYREVEFGGMECPAAMLKRHGLTAPSGHAPFERLERDLPKVLAEAKAREQRYIVCPFIDESRRRTLDDWKRLVALFNIVGEQAQRAGLAFAYHNHDFEFQTVEGELPYAFLLANTDPALVNMELDLYWMARAGHDPLAWFQRHPGRFPLLHLKDRARDGTIADVGSGTINFRRILAAGSWTHAFVEHDDPADPLKSLTASLANLKKL